MGVKINTSSIKNSRINPNISSDGLIFHIDSVYSEKSETNYLYDGFNLGAPGPGPLGSNKEYRRFTNLISDDSESFSIIGTYAQTNLTLSSFSSSPTYSFGVNSDKYAYGFLTKGDYKPVYSIFEFGGTATPGTNIKLSMWGLSGSTSKIFDVFGSSGYTFSSTQSGLNLGLTLINNFVELPPGFTISNNYNYTDSKFLTFITQDIYGWKYEGNPSYLSSNSLGSGGFTFSWVNSFTWSAGVFGSYSKTSSNINSVWTKSSSDVYTSRPILKDENLSYYIETGNYRLSNYTDQAVWDLLDSDSPYSIDPSYFYVGVGNSKGDLINISEDRLFHDYNLNRLFIPASTRTIYSLTQSGIESNDIALLLVYDTNINKLIGTVSFVVDDDYLSADKFFGEYLSDFISIEGDLYVLISSQFYNDSKIFYINKETMTSQLIFNSSFNNLPSYIKPFSFVGKKYALCSPETGNQYCFYQLSSTTASFLTFSKPETYNGWNLTPPSFNERTPVADVDISSESTFQVTGGASWSRFYVPAYGWTSSSPNPQISFLFIYQISESGGQLSIDSSPINVIEFPDTKINRIYKIPDNSEKWSTNFLPHNRDRMYLFGSVNESGRWNITGTFSLGTSNVLIGVSQSQATSGLFKTGYLYDVTFYSTSGTYSSTWTWDADPVTSGLPSLPGVSQFTSMTSSISSNNYFRFHRRSTVGVDDNGNSVIATFSEFTQLRNDFNSGGSMSMSISANSNNYWTLRKSTSDRGGINSFTPPFNDYITLEEPASPKFGYDDIGWKCLGNYNNFFYTNGDYIRNTQQTNNVDRYFTQPSSNFVKFIYGDVNYIQPDINISGVNANKNSIYTLITSATSVKLLETTLQYQASPSTGTTTGYIDLPNFGWQGINKGLTNKKKIDRTTPVWDEGSISLWFYNKDIIGTSSTFQSLFSCWEPIKRNQGTTELGSAPVYTRSTTQMSMNTEFFFGLGNFNNNGSTITIKSRTFTTHYRPDINGSFNFTPGWYNISVSRSSIGLKVYLNGVRLSVFTGSLESSHSTTTLINVSGFNEKNSFFLNRRDSRVVVGGYRQLTTGNIGGLGRTYDNIPINLFNGFFGMISVWRKELTDSEVMSNYNSFKSRFS